MNATFGVEGADVDPTGLRADRLAGQIVSPGGAVLTGVHDDAMERDDALPVEGAPVWGLATASRPVPTAPQHSAGTDNSSTSPAGRSSRTLWPGINTPPTARAEPQPAMPHRSLTTCVSTLEHEHTHHTGSCPANHPAATARSDSVAGAVSEADFIDTGPRERTAYTDVASRLSGRKSSPAIRSNKNAPIEPAACHHD